jgi:transcriptional regulator with XRE-family HTH domain
MTLGERIHLLRRRLKLSQRQLGKNATIATNTIARLERDEIEDPGSRLMLRLARALGTSTDYLLGRSDEEMSNLWPPGADKAWRHATPADTTYMQTAFAL